MNIMNATLAVNKLRVHLQGGNLGAAPVGVLAKNTDVSMTVAVAKVGLASNAAAKSVVVLQHPKTCNHLTMMKWLQFEGKVGVYQEKTCLKPGAGHNVVWDIQYETESRMVGAQEVVTDETIIEMGVEKEESDVVVEMMAKDKAMTRSDLAEEESRILLR